MIFISYRLSENNFKRLVLNSYWKCESSIRKTTDLKIRVIVSVKNLNNVIINILNRFLAKKTMKNAVFDRRVIWWICTSQLSSKTLTQYQFLDDRVCIGDFDLYIHTFRIQFSDFKDTTWNVNALNWLKISFLRTNTNILSQYNRLL